MADNTRGALEARANIRALKEYDPPESAARAAQRLGLPVDRIVKLDANENPYGPSPRVADALRTVRYEEYIDPKQVAMREQLATYVGVGPEHLLFGNGSDELIDLLMRAYLDPGDELLTFTPTFGMYSFNAEQYAARPVFVERDEHFDIPQDAALAAVTDRTRLIFVTAPNNPTGNQVPESVVEALLGTGRLVVLDEAYAEFAGRSLAGWVPARDNLLVLRTFSKWAALAGIRVGYGIFPLHVMRVLLLLKPPFNVNVAAEAAVIATLDDRDYLLRNVARLVEERERLQLALEEVPYLRPFPSVANFILCNVIGRDARELRDLLAQRGILVRHYRGPRLENCIRITVGRPDQTDAVVDALSSL
jgi:histidinol-phosphate aminotransferase